MTTTDFNFSPDASHPILFTDEAIKVTKEVIQSEGTPQDGVRVAVVGGGCSGYHYSLDFEQKKREEDIVISYDDLNVYIDPISVSYLRGTVIDYVSNEEGAGFKFNNPNPQRRLCSCCSCE